MKKIYLPLIVFVLLFAACSKNYIPTVNGTINGLPAITLYGDSRQPSDYMFINTSVKEISYNGQVLNYLYSAPGRIFMLSNGSTVAKATLDTLPKPVILTIDTSNGFSFGSSLYVSK